MASEPSFVLIIECEDADDPGSEGRFVKHMLNLMRIPNCYCKAKTRGEFLDILYNNSSHADVIHIATHGVYGEVGPKRRKFRGFWTPEGTVTLASIEAANINLSGKTVVSTACFSGQKAAREKFREATGCKFYIAPKKTHTFTMRHSHVTYSITNIWY